MSALCTRDADFSFAFRYAHLGIAIGASKKTMRPALFDAAFCLPQRMQDPLAPAQKSGTFFGATCVIFG